MATGSRAPWLTAGGAALLRWPGVTSARAMWRRTLGTRARSRVVGCGRHDDCAAIERKNLDAPSEQPFDCLQTVAFIAGHERQRAPRGAGAAGAADAVHVVLGHVRQLEIHDLRQLRDVDATRRNVGRDEHLDLVVLEVRERPRPRALRLVAVDRHGADAVAGE